MSMNKANKPGAQKASGRKRSSKKTKKTKSSTATSQNQQPTKADFKRENKRKISNGAKYVLVAIAILAMLLSVTGVACSGILDEVSSSDDEDYELTGGVAATVNGVKITEDTVTEQIMSARSSLGYDDDDDWADYLSSSGMTPESYRENVIDELVDQLLVSQAEDDLDITVSDDEVEEAWDDAVSSYDSEDDFIDVLTQVGYTEDSYKEMLRENLVSQKFYDTVAAVDDPTDDEIIDYANENLDTYNGAKRSSQILIEVDSDADDDTKAEAKQEAQDILDEINAGDISFEDAVEEYSDDSSADDGGDVGWDKLTTFVDEYQEALDGLEVGEISDVVESDYGYHIIECTDEFSVDGEVTSIDEIPEELQESFTSTITSDKQSEAYDEWLTEEREDADIVVYDMPDDVPYNVEVSDEDSSDETDESDDTTTDESLADATAADDGTEDDSASTDDADASDDADADADDDTSDADTSDDAESATSTDGE